MNIRADALKLAVFLLVGLLVLALLYLTFGRVTVGPHKGYDVVFADAGGLEEGDLVKVAGVRVGQVTELDVVSGNRIRARFDLDDRNPITRSTQVKVRYENLLGDRYLELSQPEPGGRSLPEGTTIPAENVSPSLSLDVLLNGFRPLFRGLEPEQINQLASKLLTTFEGRGGTVNDLLSSVGSLTGDLADSDEVIGTLMKNLNVVLGRLNNQDQDVKVVLTKMRHLLRGLAEDRKPFGRAISSIGRLTTTLGDALHETRPDLRSSVRGVRKLAGLLAGQKAELGAALALLPDTYDRLVRIGAHSSTFMFYLCSLNIETTGPGGQIIRTPVVGSKEQVERCK